MRAWLALATVLAGLCGPVQAQLAQVSILEARYAEPVTRYGHDVLGPGRGEWGTLEFVLDLCPGCAAMRRGVVSLRLPQDRIYEDTAPRLIDTTGNGLADAVVVVEADLAQGARLVVVGPEGLIAATPFIGTPRRWLAVLGVADLDGDGRAEIAYVDRPHLDRVLRVVRLEGRALVPVAEASGFSNHRYGEAAISGGIRDCGEGPQMVLADADWLRVMAVRLRDGVLEAEALGEIGRRRGIAAALDCRF